MKHKEDTMSKAELRDINRELSQMFRNEAWDRQYEARQRVLNLQRRIGIDGQVYIKRLVGGVNYDR